MALDGGTARQLSEALLDAFLPERLDQMLYYRLSKQRHRISMKTDYESIVFDVIRAAESEGWLDRLVAAARQSRPSDPRLFEVAQRRHPTVESGGLESILNTRAPEIQPACFRAALAAVEGQVCKIERRTEVGTVPLGTGFLIGPDLCMTSYHVVRGLFTGEFSSADINLRFDYKHSHTGGEPFPGTVFPLAHDWLVASAPNSAFEEHDGDTDEVPAAGELDFAVLRVAGAPGERPIGVKAEPGADRRGWIDRVCTAPMRLGDDLLVLQHLMGEPMRLAFGKVTETNVNATRIHHTANTDEGSSGSPCFTLTMELAAIHQGGDPNRATWHVPTYNRAIPAGAVFSTLRLR